MAGYYARIYRRTPATRRHFADGDDTTLAVGYTHGCLSCARKVAVSVDRLEQHIEALEDELREARELLEQIVAQDERPPTAPEVRGELAGAPGE